MMIDKKSTTDGLIDSPPLKVRVAVEEDAPILLRFIKKLAQFERLSHEVTVTEEALRKNLFGERKVAEAILAEYQNGVVGFAVYFHNLSTFSGKMGIFIEDLFVDESHRGRGFGLAMLVYIAKLAKDRGCGRLNWSVLDWNKPAIRFYERLGAVPLSEWTTYSITGEALDHLSKML